MDNKKSVSDEKEPASFREIQAGSIAAGVLYRSAHPFAHGIAVSDPISGLAKNAGIQCVLNLDDPDAVLDYYSKDVPWYNTLVKEKKVIGLDMDMNIPSEGFNRKLKKGLLFMLSHSGPYLIHCFAGIDRTGFVAAVLEAAMGAGIEEIYHDYLASFDVAVSPGIILCFKRGKDDSYLKEQILKKLECMHNNLPILNLQTAAEQYLLGDVGLTTAELSALKLTLSSSAV